MICQKCLQNLDISEGGTYLFYYGTLVDSRRRGNTTTLRYRLSGKEELFLCNPCVVTYAMRQRAFYYRIGAIGLAILPGVPALLLALLAQDSSTSTTFLLIGGLILVVALVLFVIGMVERKRVEQQHYDRLSGKARASYGSSLAVSVRQAALRERGFNQFFTPERMKNLKLSIHIPS